ncbi:DUF6769 family protein [Dysgonomonas sp. ZJ709]|uniref:DUF6769 family protein n=1 Tax=Dysgonomonas sp. ZJ709 TaxID=2709797 RepID=UPI00351A9FC5
MKVKKHISLILLLFANILLLAHGVLPHYHHDGIVCMVRSEACQTIHNNEKHSDHSECDHSNCECCGGVHDKHHSHDNSEDCDLKTVVLRQANNHENDTVQPISISSLFYIAYTLNIFYLDAPTVGLHLQEKPYLETYTSPFVGTIRSLRAPPFISTLS